MIPTIFTVQIVLKSTSVVLASVILSCEGGMCGERSGREGGADSTWKKCFNFLYVVIFSFSIRMFVKNRVFTYAYQDGSSNSCLCSP